MPTCTLCEGAATSACTLCHIALCMEHAIVGQPFISAWQLVKTIFGTAVRTPALLGDILFKELDLVMYCPTCREEIGARRQTEQLKFAGALFALLLVVALPVYLTLS